MSDKIIIIWLKRKKWIFHDYSIVGFLISPNLKIKKEALEKKTVE